MAMGQEDQPDETAAKIRHETFLALQDMYLQQEKRRKLSKLASIKHCFIMIGLLYIIIVSMICGFMSYTSMKMAEHCLNELERAEGVSVVNLECDRSYNREEDKGLG